MSNAAKADRPIIGVFDSGFGGLTVLRELIAALPGADFLYLGDTANLPYGSKSAEKVTRYTIGAVKTLAARGASLVVIACNTASALALPVLQAASTTPLVGVIQPGALAAAQAVGGSGTVLVLATEATVASHAYAAACASHGVRTVEQACPLLTPLVEEGWTEHPVTAQVIEIYMRQALANCTQMPSAILLGCTHYPLLKPLMERTAAALSLAVPLVDSAKATALHVQASLPQAVTGEAGSMRFHFLATDSVDKFQRLGERFLGKPIPQVERVNLEA